MTKMGTSNVDREGGRRGQARHTAAGRISRIGLAIMVVGAAACSDDTNESVEDDVRSAITDAVGAVDDASESAVELAARLFASEQASQEFADVGQPIDGDLTCVADATNDLTAVDISCSGTTTEGAMAEMTGTTSELPGASITELDGDFVGTVDGAEVFRTERLGG
jgi:hypothetical protein